MKLIAYFRQEDKSHVNDLSFHLNKLTKEQMKHNKQKKKQIRG